MASPSSRAGAVALTLTLGLGVAACVAPGSGGVGGSIMIEREGSFTAGGTVIGDPDKSQPEVADQLSLFLRKNRLDQ